MPITNIRLTFPRFAGVHRGLGEPGNRSKLPFHYNDVNYYLTGEDAADFIKLSTAADEQLWNENIQDGPANQAFEAFKATLPKKEPNYRFRAAIANKNSSEAFELLKNQEVKISGSDTPGETGDLLKRLIGNDSNFRSISQTVEANLTSRSLIKKYLTKNPTKSFISKVLAEQLKEDLKTGVGAEKWKERLNIPESWIIHRDPDDIPKSALKFAENAVNSFFKEQKALHQ